MKTFLSGNLGKSVGLIKGHVDHTIPYPPGAYSSSVTIPHNLGFIPYVEVYLLEPNTSYYDFLPAYVRFNRVTDNTTIDKVIDFTIDETDLVINMRGVDPSSVSIYGETYQFEYFMFKKRIDMSS